METVRWGIIGCGDVTEVKSGPAFNKVPNSSLVAVMRRNGDKARDYAQRHGVPKWYDNADQLINDPDVNAIYIATPPSSHEAYTLAAFAAGKPVYVEKPMTVSKASADRMRAAAQQHGQKLCVAHYRREMPMFRHIRQLVQDGTIGTIRCVTLRLLQPAKPALVANTDENWRINPAVSGGGYFFDLAPHQLDLMRYYFGPVQEAYGLCANQAGLYDAEDIVTGVMRMQSGVIINGIWCFTMPEGIVEDVCEIIGSAGRIRFTVFSNQYSVWVNGGEQSVTVQHPTHVQQPMIEAVVQYFLGNGPNPCPAEEAIEMFGVMETFGK
ncbi:Gfo/Idh/MocA family oxidoreductase [Nibrella viscosa]|uniref:Gfo/Idh/MocA family oxidoreductase n=1 Tax=Nibrella viscosa TaxID=1084524 RepID=A0ABP8K421_9BACT